MNIFTVLRNIFILIFIGSLVFIVSVGAGPARQKATEFLHLPGGDVKGATTDRAQEIQSQLKKDISNQTDSAKKQVLNIKISDALQFFSRFQKIPQDVHAVQQFGQEQVGKVFKQK